MANCTDDLQNKLSICQNILSKGYTSIKNTRLSWLNTFCLEFLTFSQDLHKFLSVLLENQKNDRSDHVEIIYLCLTQIVTCINQMENTIKEEEKRGAGISAARKHFLDRMHWCLNRLSSSLKSLTSVEHKKASLPEDGSFVDLMDRVLDLLSPYSSYKEELKSNNINVVENQSQAMFDSQDIRNIVNLVLSHTLAFANVALKEDKKALSALCQKVLRDCIAFQDECKETLPPDTPLNESYRKLKAISLENALYKLEDYINEALLRLVYTCFLDFNKFSIDKLRKVIKERDPDDPELDELIADFDVNVDRTTQIGIFAIAFAPNVKIKTVLRSCLASFESLDSCIIPSLQAKGTSDIYAKLLEQHFNEEVSIFKNTIQKIVDSRAFASCYFELLTQTIQHNDKEYNKESLDDIIKMAQILYQHFHFQINYQQLRKESNRLELYNKFSLILQECQTVLVCEATVHLEPERILKRFKILRSILRKLIDELADKTAIDVKNKSSELLMSDDLSDSQQMFTSIGISPSIRSILYNNKTSAGNQRKQRLLNNSNCSELSMAKSPVILSSVKDKSSMLKTNLSSKQSHTAAAKNESSFKTHRSSLRRKESMRTALFKRQKSYETHQICSVYENNSESLQISEILDQLTGLSSNLSKGVFNKIKILK